MNKDSNIKHFKSHSDIYGFDDIKSNNIEFPHLIDQRNEQQIQKHHQFLKNIAISNSELFKFKQIKQTKEQYFNTKRIRVELTDGWFANITDNEVESEFTILTIHGVPGNEEDWAPLETEMKEEIRWINFVIPGYDGINEKRGTYNGSMDNICTLVYKILISRGVKKAIFCGHSGGTVFFPFLWKKYPHIFKGYLNIAGITNFWSIGMRLIYKIGAHDNGFGYNSVIGSLAERKKLLDDSKFRKIIAERMKENSSGVLYSEKLPFIPLSENQLPPMLKYLINNESSPSEIFSYQKEPDIIRVLLFGKDDEIVSLSHVEELVYTLCKETKECSLHPELKERIEKKVYETHNIKIDANRIQECLCFVFENTGHNVHRRRAKEISIVIRVYVTIITEITRFNEEKHSKL